MERPLVLGVETSCDDTACAVVDGCGRVLASVVSSQLKVHQEFGGVVPEIASREHLTAWPAVCAAAQSEAGVVLQEVDLIAATQGPGLIGSLLVGLSLAKATAYGLGKPFLAVHHLEGHLYSPFIVESEEEPADPPGEFIGLVVSGGHSSLYSVEDGRITTLAETRDDAMGEVFDKVGKRLGLEYPQGPKVDLLAEDGVSGTRSFTVAQCTDGSLDFSFSGLKTQAIQAIDSMGHRGIAAEPTVDEMPKESSNLLADFRAAAVAQIVDRLERLYQRRPFSTLAVSGGAAANRLLRRELPGWAEKRGVKLRLVPLRYSGDNAAMIAHAALLRHRRGEVSDPLSSEPASRLPIGASIG